MALAMCEEVGLAAGLHGGCFQGHVKRQLATMVFSWGVGGVKP